MIKGTLKSIAVALVAATVMIPSTSFASTPTGQNVSSHEFWDANEVAIFAELEADFRLLNPSTTDKQVEEYLKGVIHQAVINSDSDSATPEYLPYLVADLSDVEKALYWENKTVGDAVLLEALNAQTAAANTGLPGPHDGKQDAFRHAYWNALMLDAVGRYWATRWGTAHEDGAINQRAIERTMDLTNNERGRQAAEDVISVNWVVTDTELKNQVMWYLNNGKLVYIKNDLLVSSNT